MNIKLKKELKRKKLIRVVRLLLIITCLIIYLTLAVSSKNNPTIRIIFGLVFSMFLLAMELYANTMSLKEETFVEVLLAIDKKNMEDDKIKQQLVVKYGSNLYDKIIKTDSTKNGHKNL